MWIIIGLALAAVWLALNVVWDVASFAVHVLLALAVLAIVVHFVRGHFGRRTAASET